MFYSVFSVDVGSFFQNDFLGVIINKLQSNQTNLGVALFSRSSPGLMKNHFLQQILMMKTVVYQASLAPTSMFLTLRVPGTFRGMFHISVFSAGSSNQTWTLQWVVNVCMLVVSVVQVFTSLLLMDL